MTLASNLALRGSEIARDGICGKRLSASWLRVKDGGHRKGFRDVSVSQALCRRWPGSVGMISAQYGLQADVADIACPS